MISFDPAQLAAWTGGRWTASPASPLVGFTMDTRTLRAGEVFVALRTGKRDGHDFLAAAKAAGAGAALVAKADPAVALPQLVVAEPLTAFQAIAREHRRQFRGPVIGITGSAGKTSTKNLLAQLLGGAPGVLATEGNLNNQLGVPLTLMRLDPAAHRFAVVEAGIGAPGEMRRLAGMIRPDVAIITLVAPAHLEELGDLEGVAREKAGLPAELAADGLAVFPRECGDFAAFRELAARRLVVEESAAPFRSPPEGRAFYSATQRGEESVLTIACGAEEPVNFTLRRVSAGMARNAVLAICAARSLGVPPADIQERLAAWRPARWRGELRRSNGRLLYVDCYNANPASMADALANFDSLVPAGRPRAYVLGCMEELGPGAAEFHRRLGRTLQLGPDDLLFIVGDQADALREGVLENGPAARQIVIAPGAAAVRPVLAGFQGAVFVKGSRKHHLEQALEPEDAPC